MTITDAEIAAMCGVLAISVFKLSDVPSSVLMCEHFCSAGASTAKFAGFTNLSGELVASLPATYKSEAETPLSAARKTAALRSGIPPAPVDTIYSPTTALSVATTTSAANIDATNGKITTVAGPTGKVIFQVSVYYEWTANDVLFMRMAGTQSTTTRAAAVGISGQKGVVSMTTEMSGLTPGQAVTGTIQQWTVIAGSATAKAGGAGGAMVPPLAIVAIPA